jgi:hypothetical protein
LLIVLGVVIALFSALIDVIGIGKSGFGWHQEVGIGVGVVVAIVGIVLAVRQPGPPSDAGGGPSGPAPPSDVGGGPTP